MKNELYTEIEYLKDAIETFEYLCEKEKKINLNYWLKEIKKRTNELNKKYKKLTK